MAKLALAGLAWLLAAPAFGAEGLEGGAGGSLTQGSQGYHRLSLYGDGQWKSASEDVEPYAWGQFDADSFVTQFTVGGGAWKRVEEDLSVKGGAGVIAGHRRDSDDAARSLLLETGLEKYFETPALGAEYRLTLGSIGGATQPGSQDESLRSRARSRGGGGEARGYSYHELSGYARVPVGGGHVGARVTLGLPSYARSVLSETLSASVPLYAALSLTLAATLEESDRLREFASVGLYCRFGGARR